MWLQRITFVVCLVPLVSLIWLWQNHKLGFNPIETVQRFTGSWALKFLLLSLAITPLRRIPRLNGLIKIRRMLGLFSFFYACLHFLHYLAIDKLWEWPEILTDFQIRRFYIVGLIAWLLMVPLAATSFNAAIRWMGGKRWQLLHRLVYLAGFAAVAHYFWQGKAANLEPMIYIAVLIPLLAIRVWFSIARLRRRGSPVRATPS